MNIQIFARWRKIGNCSKFSQKYLDPPKTQPQLAGLDISPSSHIYFALFFPPLSSAFLQTYQKLGSCLEECTFGVFFHMKLGLHFCLLEAPLSHHGFSSEAVSLLSTGIYKGQCIDEVGRSHITTYCNIDHLSHLALSHTYPRSSVRKNLQWPLPRAALMQQVSLRVKRIHQKILCCCN